MIPERNAADAITLAGQGWTVSAIARHLGHDRKTIRIYRDGSRAPGQPRPHAGTLAPFAAYVICRARDDRHLRGTGLHREVTALGYAGSYSAFTRELRSHGISVACGTCKPWQPSRHTPPGHRRVQPLPIRIAPLAGETIASYLARVAAASHSPVTVITAALPLWFAARAAACDDLGGPGHEQGGLAGHLAAITGISVSALQHALPALAGRGHNGRPAVRSAIACRRCAARNGHRDPVPVHLPAHQRICARHRIWLGRIAQISLAPVPEIISAHHNAGRLARDHGITRLVLAEVTARHTITARLNDDPGTRRRAAQLAQANPAALDPDYPDMTEAACYPEIITLAARVLRDSSAALTGPK